MGELSPTHWLVVIIVALLLFGSARLPKMARSLGRSARILKAEMNGLTGEDDASGDDGPTSAPRPVQAAPVQAAPAPAPAAGPAGVPASVAQDEAARPVVRDGEPRR
ncbi:Sec-independent protein translocase subunit TatA [Actinomadura logoneensis]|uniref:Sec-independent protein translocase protein TatA n=1 Tax=Actinomadura logoneensis TaxID=2293572 RepID=A0A372JN17_9ACTN|nr:Sec-independent protein translocase subunit TatA [Actinomadura logoneensis]